MTTLIQMKDRIRRLASSTSLDDDLLLDAIRGALGAILPWHAKGSVYDITWVSGGSVALPSDFYAPDGVLSGETDKFLPMVSIRKDTYLGDDMEGSNWLIYPRGYLSIWPEPDAGDTFTLYYQGKWDVPVADTSSLDIPSYLESAVLYWATAYALEPEAASTASIRQWGTKADSGTPEHNPMANHVLFLLKLFEMEVQRHERLARGERY